MTKTLSVLVNIVVKIMDLEIQQCTMDDLKQIKAEIFDFWGTDRTLYVHQRLLIKKYGESAYVIKEGEKVMAYLIGFIDHEREIGWVHLIGVRDSHKKKGIGRYLYNHFIEYAKQNGCKKIKALTIPENKESIAFHKKIGMKFLGVPNEEGLPVIKNHHDSGQDRVEMEMDI